ncbi:MAG: hypothetical protein ACM3XR_01505 [Bacillota bacterium]
MFNLINKQFIFRQSGGEMCSFFHDEMQNLCLKVMSARGAWSNAIVLHKNVYRGFYAEMDRDNVYHLLLQDNNGNIYYSRLDGQSLKTTPVLKSRIPSAYDKHLFIAPLKNNILLFYVLQHDNSFMLAYQVFGSTGMETPKVVDYVSGSSLPCSIVYDPDDNLYAFYQSYDGKYLQLGYKKFNTASRYWSDFTLVTKYAGNCEYPHAIIDTGGTIHLCYQRRSQRLFEMVYQQKAPGRNLWSAETIIHSSVHSFDNASILQIRDRIVIYWVRDDVIYYNSCLLRGGGWGKPSRYETQFGRQLQCICYKSNSPRDNWIDEAGSMKPGSFSLSPGIFPGSTAYGLKLAFINTDALGDISALSPQPFSPGSGHADGAASLHGNSGSIVHDAFRQMQGSIAEIRESLSGVKKEISRLANVYMELAKEVDKYGIRLNIVENRLKQAEKTGSAVRAAARIDKNAAGQNEEQKTGAGNSAVPYGDETGGGNTAAPGKTPDASSTDASSAVDGLAAKTEVSTNRGNEPKPAERKPSQKPSSVDPDKMKEWEEWEGPREWQETQ